MSCLILGTADEDFIAGGGAGADRGRSSFAVVGADNGYQQGLHVFGVQDAQGLAKIEPGVQVWIAEVEQRLQYHELPVA